MKKIKVFIIPIILLVVKNIFFIPVQVTGGLSGTLTHRWIDLFLYHYNEKMVTNCMDCFYRDILWDRVVIESIITLIISILLVIGILYLKNRLTRKMKKTKSRTKIKRTQK